jgi:hypothetical protein
MSDHGDRMLASTFSESSFTLDITRQDLVWS